MVFHSLSPSIEVSLSLVNNALDQNRPFLFFVFNICRTLEITKSFCVTAFGRDKLDIFIPHGAVWIFKSQSCKTL